MELEDLTQAWAKYDQKLSNNLRLNEELLKKINLNSSKKEMQKPLITEICNIVIITVVIVLLFSALFRLRYEIIYVSHCTAAILLAIPYFIFSTIKINRLTKIDYYDTPIIELQKDIATVKRLTFAFRKYELALIPFLLIAFLPVLFKLVHNINLYHNITLFVIEVVVALAIGYPLGIWLNKHLYDKKFKNVEKLLQDISNFESDIDPV